MKFYSDKTKKVYDTVELLEAAEQEYDEAHAAELRKAEERKADAEAIEAAYKAAVAAQKHYNDLVNAFVKKHGSYHLSVKTNDWFSDLFNVFFK